MKRWHAVVATVAALVIGAYLAMIVGPHFAFGRVSHPIAERAKQ